MNRRTALALAVAGLLLTGCAPQGADGPVAGRTAADGPAAAGPATRDRPRLRVPSPGVAAQKDFPAYAATAIGTRVVVRDAPDGAAIRTLTNPLPSGAPLTLLQVERRGSWLKVLLPVRPNGSTGWVQTSEVDVKGVPYRLDVRTAAHQLDLYDRDRLVKTFPVGIGKSDTPTPGGTFFLKELLQPPNPAGDYGPYAYGLSGFSTTLDSFRGGEAVIGLHGTSDPRSVGRDVSSGCIRLLNADITALAAMLPLGTPVRILA